MARNLREVIAALPAKRRAKIAAAHTQKAYCGRAKAHCRKEEVAVGGSQAPPLAARLTAGPRLGQMSPRGLACTRFG
jgi:hypothetical protein